MTQSTQTSQVGSARKKTSLRNSRALWLVAILLLLIVLAPFAFYGLLSNLDNQGTFHNTANSADIDGDGDLDILLHNLRTESEFTAFSVQTIWLNQGDGRFSVERLETAGWASAAGDIDQDDDTDLVIFAGHHLRLYMNQGGAQAGQAGAFRRGTVVNGPERNGQYGSLVLGDIDDDGWLDGVVVGCCGRVFTVDISDDTPNVSGVWLNKWGETGGPGEMSHISALDDLALRAAELGDLNGDGALDLFAAVMTPNTGRHTDAADRVIFNDGTGNFTDSGQRLGVSDSTAVALGDLDGDGDVDALVGNAEGALLWLNQGRAQGGSEGEFVLAAQLSADAGTTSIFLHDFDSDGDLDALIGGIRQAHIWWNDGQAALKQSDQRFRYSKKDGLALGDFDGDGHTDIFAAAYDDNYRVWFNKGDGTFRTSLWP